MREPFLYKSLGSVSFEEYIMIKIKNISEAQIDEISCQIAGAFYDYNYAPNEKGLRMYIKPQGYVCLYECYCSCCV